MLSINLTRLIMNIFVKYFEKDKNDRHYFLFQDLANHPDQWGWEVVLVAFILENTNQIENQEPLLQHSNYRR